MNITLNNNKKNFTVVLEEFQEGAKVNVYVPLPVSPEVSTSFSGLGTPLPAEEQGWQAEGYGW